jgi:hypothetical protein
MMLLVKKIEPMVVKGTVGQVTHYLVIDEEKCEVFENDIWGRPIFYCI